MLCQGTPTISRIHLPRSHGNLPFKSPDSFSPVLLDSKHNSHLSPTSVLLYYFSLWHLLSVPCNAPHVHAIIIFDYPSDVLSVFGICPFWAHSISFSAALPIIPQYKSYLGYPFLHHSSLIHLLSSLGLTRSICSNITRNTRHDRTLLTLYFSSHASLLLEVSQQSKKKKKKKKGYVYLSDTVRHPLLNPCDKPHRFFLVCLLWHSPVGLTPIRLGSFLILLANQTAARSSQSPDAPLSSNRPPRCQKKKKKKTSTYITGLVIPFLVLKSPKSDRLLVFSLLPNRNPCFAD